MNHNLATHQNHLAGDVSKSHAWPHPGLELVGQNLWGWDLGKCVFNKLLSFNLVPWLKTTETKWMKMSLFWSFCYVLWVTEEPLVVALRAIAALGESVTCETTGPDQTYLIWISSSGPSNLSLIITSPPSYSDTSQRVRISCRWKPVTWEKVSQNNPAEFLISSLSNSAAAPFGSSHCSFHSVP